MFERSSNTCRVFSSKNEKQKEKQNKLNPIDEHLIVRGDQTNWTYWFQSIRRVRMRKNSSTFWKHLFNLPRTILTVISYIWKHYYNAVSKISTRNLKKNEADPQTFCSAFQRQVFINEQVKRVYFRHWSSFWWSFFHLCYDPSPFNSI